jgi:hypothetical protein
MEIGKEILKVNIARKENSLSYRMCLYSMRCCGWSGC